MARYSHDKCVELLAKVGLPPPPVPKGQRLLAINLKGPNPDPQYADWHAQVGDEHTHEQGGWHWWDNRDKAWKPMSHGPL